MTVGWKTRAGIVLSGAWLFLVLLIADDHSRFQQTLGLGLFPLLIIWGIVWVVHGLKAQRKAASESGQKSADTPEKKSTTKRNALTALAAMLVLFVGIYIATYQTETTRYAVDTDVAYLVGNWFVWGLIAFFLLRAVIKKPPWLPAIAASLVLVGGLNYTVHNSVSEQEEILGSAARAAPLLTKIGAGQAVSEREVLAQRIGALEPIVLAHAAFGRDLLSIRDKYDSSIASLDLGAVLTPASLASPSHRAESRRKIELMREAMNQFQTSVKASVAQNRIAIVAGYSLLPDRLRASGLSGLDDGMTQFSSLLTTLAQADRDLRSAATDLLDLMDANAGRYAAVKGPPANLLFRDEPTLRRYQSLISSIEKAADLEQQALSRFLQAQAVAGEKLEQAFRPRR